MKKKLFFISYFFISYIPYLFFIASASILFCAFAAYQIYHHGCVQGLYIVLLSWSMYILCIPAAHGRFIIGIPLGVIGKKNFLPEPLIWTAAAALNVVTMFLMPHKYQQAFVTVLLYRVLIVPEYWIILLFAAVGTWYRVIVGVKNCSSRMHIIVRQLMFIAGLILFFYLMSHDAIVMLNVMASG